MVYTLKNTMRWTCNIIKIDSIWWHTVNSRQCTVCFIMCKFQRFRFCWHNIELKVFPLINQKILSTVRKTVHFLPCFYEWKCCINQCDWYMNKPLSKNLQNIDRNKTLSCGECKCCWSAETNSLPLKICIFTMFLGI